MLLSARSDQKQCICSICGPVELFGKDSLGHMRTVLSVPLLPEPANHEAGQIEPLLVHGPSQYAVTPFDSKFSLGVAARVEIES